MSYAFSMMDIILWIRDFWVALKEGVISFALYMAANWSKLLALLIEHIELTALAVLFSIVIGIPLGILITYAKRGSKPVLGLANVVQAVPSMALLGFMIPLLGIGTLPSVVVVILYSLLPIIKNTYTGIENIDPSLLEVARGIGMTKGQILRKVQIPMALPVIMAGVRISAVTAVGLMTMAAFIGAGGLGTEVFQGIRTLNTNMILSGALPACLLALFIDFIMGMFERVVTPVGLKATNKSPKELKRQARIQKTVLAVTVGLLAVVVVFSGVRSIVGRQGTDITVGSKDFTEQQVLSHMVADLIEAKTDLKVDRIIPLGGSDVVYAAIQNDQIDAYVDYTGTIYGSYLKKPTSNDKDMIYRTCVEELASLGIAVGEQMDFNNTYTLAVTKETAERYGLKTISDLERVSGQLVLGCTFEFSAREDALQGINSKYPNLNFKHVTQIDSSPRFSALAKGDVDVVDAFATDGLIKTFDLVVLEDDKEFFLPYYAVPLLRSDTMERYPELMPLMEELGSKLNDDVMRELNYQVDDLARDPREVAREFLEKEGLLS